MPIVSVCDACIFPPFIPLHRFHVILSAVRGDRSDVVAKVMGHDHANTDVLEKKEKK